MSRITTRFDKLKAAGKKALIPYVTAGDPHPSVTVDLMHAMVKAGADLIELGVPFSDPMADGPVIQLACERALAHKTYLVNVLEMVTEFRNKDQDTPVILMGYANPIERMGYKTFAEGAKQAGVDGVLTVDIPPEEAVGLTEELTKQSIEIIYLLSPTTTAQRAQYICSNASGFVYYVSVKGITGAGSLDTNEVASKVNELRGITGLPIGVGFGIKDGAAAAAVAKAADGVIVGSVLVNKIAEFEKTPEEVPAQVASILAEMRLAIDAA